MAKTKKLAIVKVDDAIVDTPSLIQHTDDARWKVWQAISLMKMLSDNERQLMCLDADDAANVADVAADLLEDAVKGLDSIEEQLDGLQKAGRLVVQAPGQRVAA